VPELVPRPVVGREFSAARPVRLSDVSPRGRLRLDAAVRYLQDVSSDDTADSGLVDAEAWVVRRTVLEVERFPVLGERMMLTTWCSGTGSHWAERRISMAGDRGGSVEAATVWVHLDMASGRPRRLPAEFVSLYGEAAAGRKVKARLTLPPPAGEAVTRPWPLRITDFDVLGHVNNAAYWIPVEEELGRRRDLRAPMRAVLEHGSAVEPGAAASLVTLDGADGSLSVWVTVDGVAAASAEVR
jgi:acyl-ACP thioesterase